MNQQYHLLLTMRLRQLHAQNLKGILLEDLDRMLKEYKWKRKIPNRISEVANDIFSIKDEDVVRWLATEAKVKSNQNSLSDFSQLFYDEEFYE